LFEDIKMILIRHYILSPDCFRYLYIDKRTTTSNINILQILLLERCYNGIVNYQTLTPSNASPPLSSSPSLPLSGGGRERDPARDQQRTWLAHYRDDGAPVGKEAQP
jgi:hypothetical protein